MAEKSGTPSAPPSSAGGGASSSQSYQGGAAAANLPPPSYEQSQQYYEQGFKKPANQKESSGYPRQQGAPAPNQPIPNVGQPVIVQYINAPNFGSRPVDMTCPHCQSQIRTSTESEPGPMAWVLAGVLCVVGLWICSCIPCCIDSLNSVTHKCPNCKNFLGRYKGGM